MKLLIVSDAWHPQINGVVRTYEYLIEEFNKAGHETIVIGPADFPLNMPMPGYAEIRLALFSYARLAKMIAAHKADYLHIATEGPLGWAARRYCLKHKIPYTTAYHTQFPAYCAKRAAKILPAAYNIVHDLGVRFMRGFHNTAQLMYVATQSLEDELKSWHFTVPMHRLTRGVKLDLFRPLEPGEQGIFADLPGPVALYVGRVAIEKNIEDFLSMDWPGAKVVIGDGPAMAELKAKYPDAHFLGLKQGEELARHYRSADIFVFPSKTDTFGIVLIEALASGLPVAGYDVIGPRDIVTAPFLGAVEAENLGHAAARALENSGTPEERAAHVREHYTWTAMARQFEAGLAKTEKS